MKRDWTDLEFADWTLLPSETALLANKTGPTRLGFAVLLKFFQYLARFPLSTEEVPATVVAYVARQVGVPVEEFSRYDWEGRTVKYHRAQIRAFLGFREPTVTKTFCWLYATSLATSATAIWRQEGVTRLLNASVGDLR
jgi:Domain of unknown function (DUF4158)